jgi:hypothetical protein
MTEAHKTMHERHIQNKTQYVFFSSNRHGARFFEEGGTKIVFTYFERDFLKILLNVSRFIPVHLFDIKYNF